MNKTNTLAKLNTKVTPINLLKVLFIMERSKVSAFQAKPQTGSVL